MKIIIPFIVRKDYGVIVQFETLYDIYSKFIKNVFFTFLEF